MTKPAPLLKGLVQAGRAVTAQMQPSCQADPQLQQLLASYTCYRKALSDTTLIGNVPRHGSSSERTQNPPSTTRVYFFPLMEGITGIGGQVLLTHIPRKAHSMRTHVHTTVKQSLTAQIERLVQASFNTSLTPDISFVSVVTHSGFAASESYQNPLLSTPCITPLCNRCQSLFHPGTPPPGPRAGPWSESPKEGLLQAG